MGIYIIDVDSLNQLASQYRIEGLPTVVIMKDGVEKDRIIGYSKEETIRDVFQSSLK